MRLAVLIVLAGCGDAVLGGPPVEIGADAEPADPDAIPVAVAPDARPCAGGDARTTDPATGHCSVYVAPIKTRDLAEADCEARGGTLAVLTSATEVAIVTPLPTTPATFPDVWLGGTDAAVEGAFTWVTGEILAYTNWRTGEPNNGGTSGIPENCMILEADTAGTWDDRPCGREYPYVCELP
jgi:hypothetical protein